MTNEELQAELVKWRGIADELASTLKIDYSGPKPRIKVDIEEMLNAYQHYHEETGTTFQPWNDK